MKKSDGFLGGVDGLRLYYHTWEQARARAAFVVVHGLGEHGGRYDGFATAMAAYGFSTYALDLRGHGRSEGRRGHVRRFEFYLQDVDRFRREVAGLVDYGCPLFLLGHSMGGLIALRYVEQFDAAISGAVVVSPWLGTAMPVPAWKRRLARTLNRSVLSALPVDNGVKPEHLSRDPRVVQAYRDDPLVHARITPRLFSEAEHARELVFQRSDRIRLPLLLMLASADFVVSTPQTEAFARALPPKQVTVRRYDGFYHEVLNEPDRQKVYHDLRDWTAARLAPARVPG